MIDQYHFKIAMVSFCLLLVLSINPISALEIEQMQYHYNNFEVSIENNNMNMSPNNNSSDLNTENIANNNEEEAKKFLKEDQHSRTSNILYYVTYTIMVISAIAVILSTMGCIYTLVAAPTALTANASSGAIAAYELAIAHLNTLRGIFVLLGYGGFLGGSLTGYILYS